LNKSFVEWIKSKYSPEKVEDDLSDSEPAKDAANKQKEPPIEKDKEVNNKKVLREIWKKMF
jgi:hypothetical protein